MNNSSNNPDAFVMKGVIDRFEGDKAVIKTEDRQELIWPKDRLPQDLKESDLVELAIGAADSLVSGHQEKVAKEIIKQILHTDD